LVERHSLARSLLRRDRSWFRYWKKTNHKAWPTKKHATTKGVKNTLKMGTRIKPGGLLEEKKGKVGRWEGWSCEASNCSVDARGG